MPHNTYLLNQNQAETVLDAQGVRVTRRILSGSSAMPMELLEVDNGLLKLTLLPQRGMGIWKAWFNGVCIGWNSPVRGPVHPALVPNFDPSGLGWLEGFDELLCRCGLASNGAPDFDASGSLRYPLHGRIANLSARNIHIHQNSENGAVSISGDVYETRFHFQKLCLRTKLIISPGAASFEIHDEVCNLSAQPAEIQLMYHYNIGEPLLGAGAQVVAPIKTLVPRDQRAAVGMDTWSRVEAPDADYVEQVYFAQLHADVQHMSIVMLKNAKEDLAAAIQFNTSQLPYFVTWKNSVAVPDGYVCGIEPSTNLPNARSFEGEKGRTVRLGPQASTQFDLTFSFHAGQEKVKQVATSIQNLGANQECATSDLPRSDWCMV